MTKTPVDYLGGKPGQKIILVDGLILLFTFVTSPVCDVAQTSDGGIIIFTFIKALYVMLLRRPTVAFLLKPFM